MTEERTQALKSHQKGEDSSVKYMEQPAHTKRINTATLTWLFSYNREHVFFILGDWEGFGMLTHLLQWWQKHLFALAIGDGKLSSEKLTLVISHIY